MSGWTHAYVEDRFEDEDGPGVYVELHEAHPKGCRVRGFTLLQWPVLMVASGPMNRLVPTVYRLGLGWYMPPTTWEKAAAMEDEGAG